METIIIMTHATKTSRSRNTSITVISTLGELISRFEGYNQSMGLAVATRKGYKRALKVFTDWAGLDTALTEIDECLIDEYREYLILRGDLSRQSIRTYLRSLKVLLRFAEKKHHLAECPLVELPGVGSQVPKASLSQTELAELLEATEGEQMELLRKRARAIVVTLYGTGMRVSELCQARYSMIETLEVDGEVAHVLLIESAKRGGERPIILSGSVWSAIKSYRDALLLLPNNAKAVEDLDTLFATRSGQALQVEGVQRLISRLVVRCNEQRRSLAGGNEIELLAASPHSFRRSFAVEWLNQSEGRELDVLQEVGGWSDIETVKRHYARYKLETLIRASRRNAPKVGKGDII